MVAAVVNIAFTCSTYVRAETRKAFVDSHLQGIWAARPIYIQQAAYNLV